MNKRDLDIITYEIGRIRDRLIKKYDAEYNEAVVKDEHQEAIYICKKQLAMFELTKEIFDFIEDVKRGAQE